MGKISLPTSLFTELIDPNRLLAEYAGKLHHSRTPANLSLITSFARYTSIYLTYFPRFQIITHSQQITGEGADFIAYHRNSMKVDSFAYTPYKFKLPEVIFEKFFEKKRAVEESERFIKIYLHKYDTSGLECVVEMSVLRIGSRKLTVSVALCGEVNAPEWMVLKTDSEGMGVPVYALNAFKNLDELIELMRLYDASVDAFAFFTHLKETFEDRGYVTCQGDFRNFEFIVYEKYKIIGKIVRTAFRTAISIDGRIKYLNKDVITTFKDLIQESIRNDVARNISKLSSLMQDNANRYDGLIDELLFQIPEGVLFKNQYIANLEEIEQIYYDEVVDVEFYRQFSNIDGFIIHRNYTHADFGLKNILFRAENDFFCIKLELIKGHHIHVRLFCGVFLSHTHIMFQEALLGTNPICIKGWTDKKDDKNALNLVGFRNFLKFNAKTIVRLFRFRKFGFVISDSTYINVRIVNNLFLFKCTDGIIYLKYTTACKPGIHHSNYKFTNLTFPNMKYDHNISTSVKAIVSFVILSDYLRNIYKVSNHSHDSITFDFLDCTITLLLKDTLEISTNNKILQSLLQEVVDFNFLSSDPLSGKFYYTPNILSFPDFEIFIHITLNLLNLAVYNIFQTQSIILIPTARVMKKDLTIQMLKESLYLRNSKKITKKNNKGFLVAIKNIFIKNKFFKVKTFCSRLYAICECIDSESTEKKKLVYETLTSEWKLIYSSDVFTFQITLKEEISFDFLKQKQFEIGIQRMIEKMINDIVKYRSDYLSVFSLLDNAGYPALIKMLGGTK